MWLSQPLLPYAFLGSGLAARPPPCPSLTLPHATLGGGPGIVQVDGYSPGGVPSFLTPLTGEGSLKAPSPCSFSPWLPYTKKGATWIERVFLQTFLVGGGKVIVLPFSLLS